VSTTFGPTAIATPANALTLARMAITPALLLSIVGHGASWPALALWIVLAASDGLDGYLARRHGTTRSGAFLDPLADKVLVLGALGALVVRGTFWWPPVALIAARELGISGYRWWVSKRGISVPARWWAKVKTVVQEVAVGFALLPVAEGLTADIATAVLWLAVGLTLFTGAQYVLDGRKAALDGNEGRARAV
jgi:CDP-diacylglycerol---glycerol-3-phosphate 3-phosphatidyltransferase